MYEGMYVREIHIRSRMQMECWLIRSGWALLEINS